METLRAHWMTVLTVITAGFMALLGVAPELRKRLVREGHKVRLYVPFGAQWYKYSMRRFKSNPEIAGYVFKALFTRNA